MRGEEMGGEERRAEEMGGKEMVRDDTRAPG